VGLNKTAPRLGNGTAKMTSCFEPFLNDAFYIMQCVAMGLAVGRTIRKFGNLLLFEPPA
jgi:hypothetical protein